MCHLQFRNLFLFSPAILGFCKALYVSNLNLCVLTVHAQCTYSARTVHGHSARAGNAANDVLFAPFTARALWRALCVHCTCTVKTHALGLLLPPAPPLVVGTPSWALVLCCACRCCLPLGELVCPQLEHLCEPWCFAAACALASLSARGWNTLVSLGALLAEFG